MAGGLVMVRADRSGLTMLDSPVTEVSMHGEIALKAVYPPAYIEI